MMDTHIASKFQKSYLCHAVFTNQSQSVLYSSSITLKASSISIETELSNLPKSFFYDVTIAKNGSSSSPSIIPSIKQVRGPKIF